MLSSPNVGVEELFLLLLYFVVIPIPAFVVGQRRGVRWPGVAFVPVVGAWIVILWSIERSGWLTVLLFIPIVNLVLAIWAAFVVPADHGRTRWWALGFLIPAVNLAAFWVYAFTLRPVEPPAV